MIDTSYLVIIGLFLVYYFLILFIEKKMLHDPVVIIDRFLSLLLLYAGVSIIYFAITGKPFLSDNTNAYSVYIFIIGFVAMLWAIPNLLGEFKFFRKFMKKKRK